MRRSASAHRASEPKKPKPFVLFCSCCYTTSPNRTPSALARGVDSIRFDRSPAATTGVADGIGGGGVSWVDHRRVISSSQSALSSRGRRTARPRGPGVASRRVAPCDAPLRRTTPGVNP
eukprot:31445-Pelagococcus_subviridis.AAC.14